MKALLSFLIVAFPVLAFAQAGAPAVAPTPTVQPPTVQPPTTPQPPPPTTEPVQPSTSAPVAPPTTGKVQAEASAPVPLPTTQPVHAAVPIPKKWNIGAGFNFTLGGVGFTSGPAISGLAGLGGLVGVGTVGPQPRLTILIERRLNEHLFLGVQAAVSYGSNRSENSSAVSFQNVSVEAAAGARHVFNPGGVIEVSGFGNVGVGYLNSDTNTLVTVLDAMGASVSTPSKTVGSSFAVGAVGGLTLERELISGLALRLSSTIVGLSYGRTSNITTILETAVKTAGNGIDAGLRFSPAIEIRYAF